MAASTVAVVAKADGTNSDNVTSVKAVELAAYLADNSLSITLEEREFTTILKQISGEKKINYLRRVTMDTLALRNKLNAADLIEAYKQAALELNNDRNITLANLYGVYNLHRDTRGKFKEFDKLQASLTPYLENNDWVISHRANLILSIAESYSLDLNTALSNALEAYNSIPNEKSIYVDEAVAESLYLIAYLQNLLNNPEMAVEATEKLISKRLENGQEVDGVSLISNLIYSFGKWQDFDTTSKLAESLVALDTQSSSIVGLSQLRLAQTLNDKGDYKAALNVLDKIMPSVEHKTIRANLLINKTVAFAGLERVEDAEESLLAYNKFKSEISLNSNNLQGRELMAEALIAKAKGDMTTAFAKMQQRYTSIVQGILTYNNSSTAKQLAALENSKSRQAERESALKREAELKQQKLDQQKRVNFLLIILVGFLALAALAALIFARYRDKVSKELAIKTLQAEDADRMKSEFLGMISHELRTPLNGIVGLADLLSMQAPTADLRHKAGIILDSSNQLTHVIESIVDMSSIDGNKMELYPEPTNVQAIVADLGKVWRPIIEAKDVTFTIFVDSSLADDVTLDTARFKQCLNNLLSNAAKFTERGRVHLHVTANVIAETDETKITAIVADTGQGMSAEVQGKLFTPFLQADSTMTRKHGGSGLGLTITQSLARMMGGDVVMISNQGRGSEFTLTVKGARSERAKTLDNLEDILDLDDMPERVVDNALPTPSPEQTIPQQKTAITHAPQMPKTTPKETSDNLRGLNVLIVEDVAANHDVVKLFLSPEGCHCVSALSGAEAIDILNTQPIDVILMDIRMPDMDGIQATRAIRRSDRAFKNIPIIALTADASAETNATCMAAGVDIFLTKPVIATELIESIRFSLNAQKPNDKQAVYAA